MHSPGPEIGDSDVEVDEGEDEESIEEGVCPEPSSTQDDPFEFH